MNTPPTSVKDLDSFIYAKSKSRRTAHIPGDEGPLCASEDAWTEWREGVCSHYPDPDDWFSLCGRCLNRLDRG